MNTKQLETFLLASKTLNLTETARRLNYAQSSITSHIKRLEEELGYDLFERFGKKIILTPQGTLFQEKAFQLLRLMTEAKDIGNQQLTLTVGIQEGQCIYFIPPILSAFRHEYPDIKLAFRPANSNEKVVDELVNGSFDIGFTTDIRENEYQLNIEKLIEEEVLFVCSSSHPLLKSMPVSLHDLANEASLLTENGCSYQFMLDYFLKNGGVVPLNLISFNSIEAIKECVELNTGIAVLPESTVKNEIENGTLQRLELEEELPPTGTYLAYHKDKRLSPHLKRFIELALEYFSKNSQ